MLLLAANPDKIVWEYLAINRHEKMHVLVEEHGNRASARFWIMIWSNPRIFVDEAEYILK